MKITKEYINEDGTPFTQEEFINFIKTDDEFAKKWGELGPIYGNQWRNWTRFEYQYGNIIGNLSVDQIQNLINDLKTNPDSRRLMVNAWNVGELDQMVLPPCHYGFQVYTRELSLDERNDLLYKKIGGEHKKENCFSDEEFERETLQDCKAFNIPTRAISLMWNQRSVDTFLGLPFNIASYGLLLEIIAEIVNMVPDQLIGNLGDTHLYLNHLEQAKEQIGKDLTVDERMDLWFKTCKPNRDVCDYVDSLDDWEKHEHFDESNVPKRTREPYSLPKLSINTEFWNPGTEDGCGMGPGTYTNDIDALIRGMEIQDFQIEGYESHPTIKAPLSN
jgi:thymidylate synthase